MNAAPLTFDPTKPHEERLAIAQGVEHWLENILLQQKLDGGADDGGFDTASNNWCDGRQAAYTLARLMAARCWSEEIGCDIQRLDEAIRRALKFILRRQRADGQLDLGGAYSSNEVGFTLPALVESYKRFAALPKDPFAEVCHELEEYLRLGAEAILCGEAYTANHRWTAACAPLAAVHSLWPDARYLQKIESYLLDGIDCDDDGCWFEERSPNYNMVANHGLLVMADCLQRPEYLQIVVRNLNFILYCLQPNGEMDSSFSHRQDRAKTDCLPSTYGVARRVAQLTGNGRFTTLAQDVWQRTGGQSDEFIPLIFELDNHPAPLPRAMPLPSTYEKFFSHISLARVRREETALSLSADNGNHFFDTVRDQWGGPKRSDDWFHLHHGNIVIESVHLAGAGMTNIQPEFLQQSTSGHYRLAGLMPGWTHTLHFCLDSPQIEMTWQWHHEIGVLWRAGENKNEIELELRSDTPQSLAATFWLWIRAGVTVEENGITRPILANEIIALRGGAPVVLRSENYAVEIHGLPETAHRMNVRHESPIPSTRAQYCGGLCLGLKFPVALRLQFKLTRRILVSPQAIEP